ncbi:MAG: Hsp20/alpha crystallin family protein [Acidimicrobiales bacterium]
MPIDVHRAEDEFVASIDLPGVDPETIDLTVDKHILTVTAVRREARAEGTDAVISERYFGRFFRQLHLGDGLDLENVKAGYDNGVLTVTIPVAEKAKPRKVEVTVGAPQEPAVEVQTTNDDAAAA